MATKYKPVTYSVLQGREIGDGKIATTQPPSKPKKCSLEQFKHTLESFGDGKSTMTIAQLDRAAAGLNRDILVMLIEDATDPDAQHIWLQSPKQLRIDSVYGDAELPASQQGVLNTKPPQEILDAQLKDD